MSAPLVVVVLVAMSEAQSPSSQAMVVAAESVLGGEALIVVRGASVPVAEAEADRLEVVLHADALAEVTWLDGGHEHAHIRLHLAAREGVRDRDLVFSPSDAPGERGRSIGLALASMIPPAGTTGVIDTTGPTSASATVATSTMAAPPPRRFGELDVVALATRGIGGYAGGFGGEVGVRVPLSDVIRLRVAGGIRLGEIPPALASASTLRLALGGSMRTWSSGGTRPFALGARADLLLLRHAVARVTPDQTDISRDVRWIPGADLMLEGAWSFVADAALLAGAGVEVGFGTTHVYNAGEPVAVIPRTRLVIELGLSARF